MVQTVVHKSANPPQKASACKDTSKKLERSMQAVWVSFRSLIVQRDQLDTYWGAKKILFLIRDIDGRAMAAAPVESCQDRGPEVSLGSPRVGTRRGQSPTPRTRALLSVDTYQYRSPAALRALVQVRQLLDPELSGELQARAHAA